MSGSTIGSTLFHIVLLDAEDQSPLTITPTGAIVPFNSYGPINIFQFGPFGGIGLLVEIGDGSVLNEGLIAGPDPNNAFPFGSPAGPGGAGVVLPTGVLTNDGSITGGVGADGPNAIYTPGPGTAGGAGVVAIGGVVTNAGVISGGAGGIGGGAVAPGWKDIRGAGGAGGAGVDSTGGNLTNYGAIIGGDAGHIGYGGSGGIGLDLAHGNLTNQGTIIGGVGDYKGAGGSGVHITSSDATNGGTIIGGAAGLGSYSAGGPPGRPGGSGLDITGGNLTNNGTIIGGAGGSGGCGVHIAGGNLVNKGTIIGGTVGSSATGGWGVQFVGSGTIIDAGFIGGGNDRAIEFDSAPSLLMLAPGAELGGQVVANAAYSNVLALEPGSGTGLVTGLGSSITGFGTIEFDPAASWLVAGNAAGLAAGQTILGFAAHDTIELTGFAAISDSFTGNGLVLSDATSSATIGIRGSFATTDFNVFSDAGSTTVEIAAPCFVAGTRIGTNHGEVAVESLRIGDRTTVLHAEGSAPIVWIGHRIVNCALHPDPRQVWPVRVAAGAFGDSRPWRDLWLSPDHAVFAGNVLIPIKHLINDVTIVQMPMVAVTYYHIELSRHSVLLAEGLLAESYLDTDDRANFANGGKGTTLFADFPARAWEAAGCAPLVVAGPKLDEVRALLNAVAGSDGTADGRVTRRHANRGIDDRGAPVTATSWPSAHAA